MAFFSTAYAAEVAADTTAAGALGGGDLYSTMLMLGVFAVLVYFMLLRPQNKRLKAHRDLVSSLEVGDEVVINGGIMGKITKMTDDFVSLSIADNVEIKCQRQAITTVLPKGTIKG
jgi:preprotein translocase subunit YajC